MKRILVGLLIVAGVVWGQITSMPVGQIVGSGAPGMNCLVGQHYFRTDAVAGANIYVCTALPNVWTLSGGGVTGTGTVDVLAKTVNATGPVIGDSRVSETDQSVTTPTIGAELVPNWNFASGLNGWTPDPAAAVGAFVFTGGGLDDATAGGTSTYGGTTFTVEIDASVPSPDTFRWRRGAGAWTSGVAITGAAQTLSDGFTVTFAALDGHTVGDSWVSTVTSGWAIDPGTGLPTSVDGDGLTVAPAAGMRYVEVVVATASADPGAKLELSDDGVVYNTITAAGTYTAVLPYFVDLSIAATGNGWVLTSASVKVWTPYPAFFAFANVATPTEPLEVRYGGTNNIGIGFNGVLGGNTGSRVNAIGQSAAANNTGADVNALGLQAALNNTGADVNALGGSAASSNTGTYVNAIGVEAAYSNTGSNVNALGLQAALNNTGADVNALGAEAATSNTGSRVNALGQSAAYSNTGADVNALGVSAATSNTGSRVNALGVSAALNNTGADVNALGLQAALNNTGDFVNAIGFVDEGGGAATNNTGVYVNAIGVDTATNNTGAQVDAIGYTSAENNTGSGVVALGIAAARNNSGSRVNAIGMQAAFGNTGADVNAIGQSAALSNTGTNVNAIGPQAALSNTGADINAIGSQAAYSNTGTNVNAIGPQAALSNTGDSVSAMGYYALNDKLHGNRVSAVMEDSLVLGSMRGTQKGLEDSVVLGSVTMGAGTSIAAPAAVDLVVNGHFAANINSWTVGAAAWAWDACGGSGCALSSGYGTLTANAALTGTAAKYVKISVLVTVPVGEELTLTDNGAGGTLNKIISNTGTFYFYYKPPAANMIPVFTSGGATAVGIAVDSITVEIVDVAANIISINGEVTANNQTVIGNPSTTEAKIYGALHPDSFAGAVPAWRKYALVAIANGVNGCANANGCWQVNGVLGANKAAGLTQDVVLGALPANWHVSDWSVKTATACTGATTALSGLGVTSNNVLFRAQTYDIMAAVSNTNLTTGPTAGAGANTAAGTNLIASLITTVANVDQLVAGCAVDVHVLYGVRP